MIVSFPYVHFEGKKHQPLSKLMILTLIAASEPQRKDSPLGTDDINASFGSLMQRGLIISKEATINNVTESIWEVTPKAIEILKSMGLEVPS